MDLENKKATFHFDNGKVQKFEADRCRMQGAGFVLEKKKEVNPLLHDIVESWEQVAFVSSSCLTYWVPR